MRRLAPFSIAMLLANGAVMGGDVSGEYTQGPGGYYRKSDRSGPYAVSPDGTATLLGVAPPLNVMAMPFVRATQSPFVFPFTTTPQQFLVTQPANTNTYRAFNPCVHAHVRITSVRALGPVVSEPTAYPGVRRVTSATEVIDRLTGYRFGSGAETLGSAANPMGGADRIVSGMIVPITGYQADLTGVTCEFELGYGQSG